MADDENKTERVQLLMTPSEVKAIDDWMFANHIRTRAEAIRRLCQGAIAADQRIDEIFAIAKKSSDRGLWKIDDLKELFLKLQKLVGIKIVVLGSKFPEGHVYTADDADRIVSDMIERPWPVRKE